MTADTDSATPRCGILCLNIGSSSLKVAGYALAHGKPVPSFAGGHDETTDQPPALAAASGGSLDISTPSDRPALVRAVLAAAQAELPAPLVVAHRIVHDAAAGTRRSI